jgi:FlgD Ig-like domain
VKTRFQMLGGSVLAAALIAMATPGVLSAAPVTAQRFAIQGVARDLDDVPIPSGNIAVRLYADSLGGTPLYDSGTEFNGTIAQGIFDVVVGQSSLLLLDQEQSYFLELDVAGTEVIGDGAGARWRWFPGGGNHGRGDLEARLAALETAMGVSAAAARIEARRPTPSGGMQVASGFANVHGVLGLGRASGTAGGVSTTANLLAMPVGIRTAGAVVAQLGPWYLVTPTPNPIVRFVHDVPGDQGRSVRLKWRNDQRERPYVSADPMPRITGYALYRRVPPGQSVTMRAKPGTAEALALPPGDWDVLTTVPATLDSTYQTVVPTLCDSTPSGICFNTFLVRAISDQVGIYYNSLADSGYSVDNLVPGVPQGLTLQAVSGGAQLSWQPSTAPDFQYFRVYRGTDPGFIPAPGSLVHATETTQWLDPTTGSFTYKVTAVDFNGNESPPAVASSTVAVETRAPLEFALASVVPNPFRHQLTFTLDVPEGCGPVDLTLFDVTGRRVRTIISGTLPAARHTFHWNAITQEGVRAVPGVYLVRLTGAGRSITRRVSLLP